MAIPRGPGRAAAVLAGVVLGLLVALELGTDQSTVPLAVMGATALLAASFGWYASYNRRAPGTPSDDPAWDAVEQINRLQAAFSEQAAAGAVESADQTAAAIEPFRDQAPPEVRDHVDAMIGLARVQVLVAKGDTATGMALLDEVEAPMGEDPSWLALRVSALEIRHQHLGRSDRWAEAEAAVLGATALERERNRTDLHAPVRWPYLLLAAAQAAAHQGAHDRACEHLDAAAAPCGWLDDPRLGAHVAMTRLELARLANRRELLPALITACEGVSVDLGPGTDEWARWQLHQARRAVRDAGDQSGPPPRPIADPRHPDTVTARTLAESAWERLEEARYEMARQHLDALQPHLDRFDLDGQVQFARTAVAIAEHRGELSEAHRCLERLDALIARLDPHAALPAQHDAAMLRFEIQLSAGALHEAEGTIDSEERRLLDQPGVVSGAAPRLAEVRARLARERGDWAMVERLTTAALGAGGDIDALPGLVRARWIHLIELSALAAAARGDAEHALERLAQADAIVDEFGGPRWLASQLRTQMGVLWRVGQTGRARLLVGPLVAACEGLGWVAFGARAHADAAELGLHLGEDEMARSHLNRAIAAHRRLGNEHQVGALSELLASLG